jgi:hypothetical protein
MNGLTVKTVPFMGAELMAAKDEKTGKIHVGVAYICKGIGLTTGQMQNERKRVKEDIVLKQGERNFVLPTAGGDMETICLDIDFLPLWLAKITITPAMQAEQPEVTEKLVQYQLKAKDVLADAFLHKKKVSDPSQPRLGEVNSASRIITKVLKDAGVSPQFIAANLKNLYAKAGINIAMDGIAVEEKFYDKTAIAQKLGILSSSGIPHSHAIGAIIAKIEVSADEMRNVPFQDQVSGHSDTNWQYAQSVVDKVTTWLEENSYPSEINYNGKIYKVSYIKKSDAGSAA